MKHFRLFSAVLLAATITTAGIFTVQSCKKETTLNPASGHELSTRDLKINNVIKAFHADVDYIREHPSYKSGESYSADSAIWLLEATINYSHTFPNDYYGQMVTDTLYLSLTTNNAGEVDMNELAQKYDEMKASISQVYHSKPIENKGLVLVNLEDISFKSDEVEIEVVAVTGELSESTPNPPAPGGPFWVGDNWWYGERQGLCSENTSDASDAAKQLKLAILEEFSNLEHQTTMLNLQYFDIKGGDPRIKRTDWNDVEDNHLDYLLFFASDNLGISDDTLCVEWQEMNLYYSYLKLLLFSYLPENIEELEGLEIASVYDIEGFYEFNQYEVDLEFKHLLKTYYGFRIEYEDGEEPSEI